MIYIYRAKLIGWFVGVFIAGMFVGTLGFKLVFFIGAIVSYIYWYFYNRVEYAQERREHRRHEVRQ